MPAASFTDSLAGVLTDATYAGRRDRDNGNSVLPGTDHFLDR